MKDNSTSLDGLLNRRVMLEQPVSGYRVAIDTVLLAAAVPAQTGDRVLDIGCGVGGAFLCLACRVPELAGMGIEIQPDLVELCRRNIERNSFAKGFEVIQGDATHLQPEMHNTFDHVLINPPYHDADNHDVSVNAIKRTANSEIAGDLALWIASAALVLKNSGILTLIHRADRRDEILSHFKDSFGAVEILSLLPKQGSAPKRIIIRARKNAEFSVQEKPSLILHKDGGGYSDKAEAVLRDMKDLLLSGE